MTDRQLKQTAIGFRRGILGKRSSDLMCFAVCAPLQGYLSMLGVETVLVKGVFHKSAAESVHMEHYWLRLPDGRILDPTADQFTGDEGQPMPKVYIGALPDGYEEQ